MTNVKCKIVVAFVAMVFVIAAFAAPANRCWQECVVSDGTTCLLRLVGDECFHYWETESGTLAIEQPDGTFVLTDQPVPLPETDLIRKAARADNQPNRAINTPTQPQRGLLILVQFADTKFQAANDSLAFVDMLNKAGYNYDGASGSAADYFKAQSNNQYAPVFDIFGPVTLANNVKYYGEQNSSGSVHDMYIADFVIDAVNAAQKSGCDFSLYDGDNDGYVDIVYLLYAGRGQADGGATETIWPHNWQMKNAYSNTHNYITSLAFLAKKYDGKKINNYACSAELNKSDKRSGIGTFCHEFSHVLGLPDYYPTTSNCANRGKNYTPGAWSVMDQGLYNNSGKTPPNYSAADKYFMGWATPKHLPKDKQTDITLTTDYGDAYQITGTDAVIPKGFKSEQRIWYLENRQKIGWDAYLPGHGLCIWEVAYNTSNWKDNKPNNDTVGYTIVTAGNQTRPYLPYKDKSGGSSYNSTTPFPGTTGKKTFTAAEGCALSAITENAGTITFKYNGGTPAPTEYPYEFLTTNCTVEEGDGMVATGSPLELQLVPNTGYTLADASCWDVEMGGTSLNYGTDFTYDATTSTFRIPSVTGDVVILAEAIVYVPSDLDLLRPSSHPASRLIFHNGVIYIERNNRRFTISGSLIL